jgi:hypothetical protein
MILSDPSLKFNQKARYVLSQKWCWGLILIAITGILFSNCLMIILIPKPPIYITLPPGAWGAEEPRPGLRDLDLPVDKVVVTDTGDAVESCTTKVRSKSDFFRAFNEIVSGCLHFASSTTPTRCFRQKPQRHSVQLLDRRRWYCLPGERVQLLW